MMHRSHVFIFFFNDPATTEIYTLPLHDALPICQSGHDLVRAARLAGPAYPRGPQLRPRHGNGDVHAGRGAARSEEHTSELQSRQYLVCRLLLEKKKKKYNVYTYYEILNIYNR